MRTSRGASLTRRHFVAGLTALPTVLTQAWAQDSKTAAQAFRKPAPPITSADQVVNVMDFEALARDVLPPAHFGYLATGVDDDRTVVRNHEAFAEYEIRSHRFNDVSRLNTSLKVFGNPWSSPIYLSAVSAMRAFHPEGEVAVGRAARARTAQLMLSSGSSDSLETVQKEYGTGVWQQIYPTDDWAVTAALIRRAEGAGCAAVTVTVDSRGGRNNETLRRAMLVDNRQCTNCHANNSHNQVQKAPLFAGIDVSHVKGLAPMDQGPQFLQRVRAAVKGKLILKGVVTAEDAHTAVTYGADAIVVSNHGGRNEETLRPTLECLPEIVAAVSSRVPVFLDGGIRRGTDVYKALALGATAVGIGRPYGWGLAAFGQPGVEAVIDILNRELTTIMRSAGVASVADIAKEHLVRASPPPPGLSLLR